MKADGSRVWYWWSRQAATGEEVLAWANQGRRGRVLRIAALPFPNSPALSMWPNDSGKARRWKWPTNGVPRCLAVSRITTEKVGWNHEVVFFINSTAMMMTTDRWTATLPVNSVRSHVQNLVLCHEAPYGLLACRRSGHGGRVAA